MAKKIKEEEEKKITPEGIRKAMELEQDAINAALAGAVTTKDGAPVKINTNINGMMDGAKTTTATAPICATHSNPEEDKTSKPQPEDVTKDFQLSASEAFKISQCNYDANIDRHINAINGRILNEAKTGGYSTNISFNVTQQDWVNISHILDWYRVHGFDILNFEQTTSPYGKTAGVICYNFTISWVKPA